MILKIFLAATAALTFASAHAMDTPYLSCRSVDFVEPETDWGQEVFRTKLENDTALEFVGATQKRLDLYLEKNSQVMASMQSCLQPLSEWPDKKEDLPANCQIFWRYFRYDLPMSFVAVRQALAFAAPPLDWNQKPLWEFESQVSIDLEPPPYWPMQGSYARLSADEIRMARDEYYKKWDGIILNYFAELKDRLARDPSDPDLIQTISKFEKAIKVSDRERRLMATVDISDREWQVAQKRAWRYAQVDSLSMLLQIVNAHRPLMFMRQANPTPQDLSAIFEQMRQGNTVGRNHYADLWADISQSSDEMFRFWNQVHEKGYRDIERKWAQTMEIDPRDYFQKIYEILSFHPIVEEILLENPDYCAVATAIATRKNNKELASMIVTGGFLLAAGLVFPPSLSLPLVMGANYFWMSASQKEFQKKLALANMSLSPTRGLMTPQEAYLDGARTLRIIYQMPAIFIGVPVVNQSSRAAALLLRR